MSCVKWLNCLRCRLWYTLVWAQGNIYLVQFPVMLNEAKSLRPRPRPELVGRGRGRGQSFEAEAEAEAKILVSRPAWPRGLNITDSSTSPPREATVFRAVSFASQFLADRTIGRAYGTVCRLSSVRLSSVTFWIVAKRCVLAKKCLKE